jgi:ClpX C4-type zinc finger
MLQGQAKRDYMRDYMRRWRAGEPTAKPKPEWEPPRWMIDQVTYWFRVKLSPQPWRLRGTGSTVVHGLAPHNADGTVNEAGWAEALLRYKAELEEQRDNRKRAKAEPPAPKCCSFCGEPRTDKRVLVGDGGAHICAKCTRQAVRAFAKHAAKKARR